MAWGIGTATGRPCSEPRRPVVCPQAGTRGGRFYVHCLPDGTRTGFAAVLIDPGLEGRNCFGHKAELLDVIIREAHRGKGYGSALLSHAESEARAAGAYCLYVATYAGNADSMTFYINRGFVPVALHPDVHGPGDEGEVHLRKVLSHQDPNRRAGTDR